MVILPYKMASKSAKALARALDVKRVRHDGNFKNNYNHLVVNWGSSRMPDFPVEQWLNHPDAVKRASNKLLTFNALRSSGVSIPIFTDCRDEAERWNTTVVCRGTLTGHSGQGICIRDKDEPLPDAPLYVEYIKKQDEYRFHVFRGEVLDVQQKRKRRETDNSDVNYQVRNSGTGWVYCRDDVTPDDSLSQLAIDAVSALGLDFGAVDIIWNNHRQQGYVLEVNTACGLEGTTLETYAQHINNHEIIAEVA